MYVQCIGWLVVPNSPCHDLHQQSQCTSNASNSRCKNIVKHCLGCQDVTCMSSHVCWLVGCAKFPFATTTYISKASALAMPATTTATRPFLVVRAEDSLLRSGGVAKFSLMLKVVF